MMMEEWHALFEEATKYERLVHGLAHSGHRVWENQGYGKCAPDQRYVYELGYGMASDGAWGRLE
jgi:hypothetical protein